MSSNYSHIQNITRIVVTAVFCFLGSGCLNDQQIFLKACHEGDVQKVERLVKKVGVDYCEKYGLTGLMIGAKAGQLNIVRFLLSQGAGPFTMDDNGNAVIDYALAGGCQPIVKEILDAILQNNNKDAKIHALMSLSRRGTPDMVEMVISSGVNVDAKGHDDWTALMTAICKGNVKVCEWLLQAGANPNIGSKGSEKTYPVIIAAVAGREDIVALLVKHKVDLTVRDHESATAFMRAMMAKHYGVQEKLLELGCDPNERYDGLPVLFLAVEMGDYRTVQMLLDYGAQRESVIDGVRVPLSFILENKGHTNELNGLTSPDGKQGGAGL